LFANLFKINNNQTEINKQYRNDFDLILFLIFDFQQSINLLHIQFDIDKVSRKFKIVKESLF